MPNGGLLAAAGAGLTVAAILALKRRHAREWFARGGVLPTPATGKPTDAPAFVGAPPEFGDAPRNPAGYSQYVLEEGNFTRGMDMNRRTRGCTDPSLGPCRTVPHWGVDIGARVGTPVYAVKAGSVYATGRIGGYGRAIQLAHEDGRESTLYAHLSRIDVTPGQRVRAGQKIGEVGRDCTGPGGEVPPWCPSMPPHLHMEVHPFPQPRLGARRRDPVVWLRDQNINLARQRRTDV